LKHALTLDKKLNSLHNLKAKVYLIVLFLKDEIGTDQKYPCDIIQLEEQS